MNRSFPLAALILASCRPGERAPRAPAEEPRAQPPGIRFEPQALAPGTPVGSLSTDSVRVRLAVDSVWVGTAWFRGELPLSGRTLRHPDSDVTALCFEADSASAALLPRWAGDERRAWFCFENSDAAARVLGPATEPRSARVVIDRFTIQRGLSDQVNSARFVRAISQ